MSPLRPASTVRSSLRLSLALAAWLAPAAGARAEPPAAPPAAAPPASGAASNAGPADTAPVGSREAQQELARFIFEKMGYDRAYFARVLGLDAQGRTDGKLTREEFAKEVARARANGPVLARFFEQEAAWRAGRPFSLPASDEVYRVYTNLIALLNVLQAHDAGDWRAAVEHGKRVAVKQAQELGQTRERGAAYYVKLWREYYFLMASAHFRLGNDTEAVAWMARIEGNADLQKLRTQLASETPEARAARLKAERLATLRARPIALLPVATGSDAPDRAWLSVGLPEVLASDLVQHTDLVVVERTQLSAVVGEAQLAQSGVTDARAAELGRQLQAGTLVTGSVLGPDAALVVTLRLVDAETGEVIASESGTGRAADLFRDGRRVLLALLQNAQWLDSTTEAEFLEARAPRTDTVRDLMKARLLKATKSDEAKALYARIIREDPSYANLFTDLKAEFSDVSATVAVLPFVNVSGRADDAWMVKGVQESLSTDLPKMRFTVVERGRLDALLGETETGQVIGEERARDAGARAGADFLSLGSVLHQGERVRIDARFVEVKSGVVLFTESVEGAEREFMPLLVELSKAIAAHFNEKLSEQTLEGLAARKTSREDFEKFVRQELAKESLGAAVAPSTVEEEPSRAPFWGAVGGAAAGTALAATGFLLSVSKSRDASYSDALAKSALREEDRSALVEKRDAANGDARLWNVVGFTGLGLAVGAVAYIVYDEVTSNPRGGGARVNGEPLGGGARRGAGAGGGDGGGGDGAGGDGGDGDGGDGDADAPDGVTWAPGAAVDAEGALWLGVRGGF